MYMRGGEEWRKFVKRKLGNVSTVYTNAKHTIVDSQRYPSSYP